jgi:CRP/FNR family transcriptional regulator
LELSDRFGESDEAGIRITLKLKREDLAQMTAVTVETVVRLLHDFQENKLITVRGRELKILNADRLTKIAGMPPSR